jgi:ATP-dependent protease HslVU (ClpYQ) peptidase subunit
MDRQGYDEMSSLPAMTCIVGVEGPERVVIGGDSAGVTDDDLLVVRADEKVFSLLGGELVLGFTDSFRMGQLLRYSLRLPRRDARDAAYGADPDRFMATTFVDAVRSCLKKGGFARKEDEAEAGGTFLVGWRARLYEVDDDYQVGRSVSGYTAVGGGAEIAFGALHATDGVDPSERVERALEAASAHSATVRPPFVVLATRG